MFSVLLHFGCTSLLVGQPAKVHGWGVSVFPAIRVLEVMYSTSNLVHSDRAPWATSLVCMGNACADYCGCGRADRSCQNFSSLAQVARNPVVYATTPMSGSCAGAGLQKPLQFSCCTWAYSFSPLP
ncbi:hypothetical protein EV426DRAFT_371786 [Tirmania nivea]|nr:hypothetical protein EV426DRAFT_371786 [Tirmania nivea]